LTTSFCKGLLVSAFFTFGLNACGPQGGDVSGDGKNGVAATCATGGTVKLHEASLGPEVHPETFSGRYKRLLIQRKSQKELQPSGEAIREYRVTGLELSVAGMEGGWESLEMPADADPTALVGELMRDEDVVSIEPDFKVSIDAIEESGDIEEAAVRNEWAHTRVDAPSAWKITRGSERVVVAVIDGGVDIKHPALKDNIFVNTQESRNGRDDDKNGFVDDVHGWDFVKKDNDPRSDTVSHFHGSHVAGIVGAISKLRTVGFAPKVSILPLRFIASDGSGNSSDAIRAIDYAIKMKAHIINASWSSTNYSKAMYDAITRARKAGILFVAASGNHGLNIDKKPYYPASYPHDNILSVGASNGSDRLAPFSDYGVKNVDFVAPGTSILSTKNGTAYGLMSGTSMATPVVAGIAVLIKARHQNFTYRQIASSLVMGVDKISGLKGKVKYGGRVNALKALQAADRLKTNSSMIIAEGFVPETEECG
jgi:subtilisin family serine protease